MVTIDDDVITDEEMRAMIRAFRGLIRKHGSFDAALRIGPDDPLIKRSLDQKNSNFFDSICKSI
jgi:hypothetical protein